MGRKFSRDSGMDVFVIVVIVVVVLLLVLLFLSPPHSSFTCFRSFAQRRLPRRTGPLNGLWRSEITRSQELTILSIKRRKNINRNSSEKKGGMIYLCH